MSRAPKSCPISVCSVKLQPDIRGSSDWRSIDEMNGARFPHTGMLKYRRIRPLRSSAVLSNRKGVCCTNETRYLRALLVRTESFRRTDEAYALACPSSCDNDAAAKRGRHSGLWREHGPSCAVCAIDTDTSPSNHPNHYRTPILGPAYYRTLIITGCMYVCDRRIQANFSRVRTSLCWSTIGSLGNDIRSINVDRQSVTGYQIGFQSIYRHCSNVPQRDDVGSSCHLCAVI